MVCRLDTLDADFVASLGVLEPAGASGTCTVIVLVDSFDTSSGSLTGDSPREGTIGESNPGDARAIDCAAGVGSTGDVTTDGAA